MRRGPVRERFYCGLEAFTVGRFLAACCVKVIFFPKSVIPACFKRESRRVQDWTPDKSIRG
jgi:hypothetical protein